MQQSIRPLVGVRHYHIPRIEYQIPQLADYIGHWGGRSPAFNLLGEKPGFLTSVERSCTIFLRRRGVARLVLSQQQQTAGIAFFLAAGIAWRVYPLAFFLLMAFVGAFSVCYRQLFRCDRQSPAWKGYRQVSFYSALLFFGMVLMTLVYLRISF